MPVIDARDEVARINRLFYEHVPEMGLRNYWHPVCLAREIGSKPRSVTLMGDRIALIRRNDQLFAVADECPHRGTRLSKGTCEFPGSNTITCRYHGWTFDLADGALVAALTDGPDSAIVGKVRVRTYPVEVRQGIVWIWLSDKAPIPVEEDIPDGLLNAASVHVVQRHTYGNWRWHVENPGLGHATMLHRDSLYMRMVDFFGYAKGLAAELKVEGPDGEWLHETFEEAGKAAEYPGLGPWPVHRFGEVIKLQEMPPVRGVNTIVSVKLPGMIRVTNFPILGAMYYEWFVQTDENHYRYFQVACGFHRSLIERLYFLLRFYSWGRFVGMVRFNKQDLWMVEDSHDFAKKHGGNDPAPLYRPDGFQIAWRKYALANLRGLALSGLENAKAQDTQPEVRLHQVVS